ncbi:hypothetical protein OS493_015588 [Desmophyllum pertusum]|uniref:Uncharacterized protein n=1 Tax=Desmophyllum pertusum TaxID=174260 RepID=A0A9X0CKW1_9CNID|nr:hypothetical protein OS493_015588 [Desmophyllum pertusum]
MTSRVMAILADEDQLKVTVKSSGYGGLIAGITTTIGGLVAGPPGLLVGGALGGALAYSSAGNFQACFSSSQGYECSR